MAHALKNASMPKRQMGYSGDSELDLANRGRAHVFLAPAAWIICFLFGAAFWAAVFYLVCRAWQ